MMDNKLFLAQQINRALQLFAKNLTLPDDQAMEIADLYPEWQIDKSYRIGDTLKYGVNQYNETQLYEVLQEHISSNIYNPDETPSMYKKIGFTDAGIPIWTQPLGSIDAYMKDDIVSHKNKTWVSGYDNNVWEPGVFGWTERL